MFKKRLPVLIVAAAVVCAIFIPPVRAAAESALSVFRVADAKTITISVGDLQELMALAEKEKGTVAPLQSDKTAETFSWLPQLISKAESDIQPISGVQDFTAFSVSLPSALQSETPALYAAGSQSQTVTLNTKEVNEMLTALGATALVDEKYDGTVITVSTPAAFAAVYSGVMLTATQNVYIDAPDDVLTSLWNSILSIPAIPADLRAQLQVIAPQTRDIYLPVIQGLGRETNLGGATGYIYTAGDLAGVLGAIPGFSGSAMLTQLQDKNASALIWTKDGVLYCLDGAASDSELSRIARSIG